MVVMRPAPKKPARGTGRPKPRTVLSCVRRPSTDSVRWLASVHRALARAV
jgi:hypothetical protein